MLSPSFSLFINTLILKFKQSFFENNEQSNDSSATVITFVITYFRPRFPRRMSKQQKSFVHSGRICLKKETLNFCFEIVSNKLAK